ncbi:hypothetical protein J2T57_001465 [Natronocella acetinitrilica]|uniref:Uncharacterized protein n=1 Tax=Natronocella acetinitrilica TaxID=414046 RepID=A0AAE3G387_9GAMM|nr:hypothetical protein [Natronocella acetinitrilica]MCP1674363.1 hypothetical protein [Natronocella acetinitrilica]
MARRLRFADLPEAQQAQARSRFIDARAGDGYRYELDCDGKVLCRQKDRSGVR